MFRRVQFIVLLASFAGLLCGCEPNGPPVTETPPPPVSVSQPVVKEVIEQDSYDGRIGAVETVEVRARVRGHLIKVDFEAGQIVKKDALLYEIDPRTYQAALDAAKAQQKAAEASLRYAQAEFKRIRGLVSQRAASLEELDVWTAKQIVASGDLLKAEAAVKEAQLNVDFTKIQAPITGKVSRTQVDVGNLVNAGGGETLLTTIVSVDPMYVYFDVPERALRHYREHFGKKLKLKEGSAPPSVKELKIPVYVGVEGEEGYPNHGLIDFTDNRVNPGTGTIQIRGVLFNPKRLLDLGMRARVRVPVSDPTKTVLITQRAVGTDQSLKFVYVVTEQNVAERRDVKLGREYEGLVAIDEGIKPEDWIVVNGIQRVRDGAKVERKQVAMPGTSSPMSLSPGAGDGGKGEGAASNNQKTNS
jgi:RND family efflux transporter MFP subunit